MCLCIYEWLLHLESFTLPLSLPFSCFHPRCRLFACHTLCPIHSFFISHRMGCCDAALHEGSPCATYELNYSCNEQRNKSKQRKEKRKTVTQMACFTISSGDIMDQLPYRLHRVDSLFIIYYYCCYYLVLFDFSTVYCIVWTHRDQSEPRAKNECMCICDCETRFVTEKKKKNQKQSQ